MTAEEKEAAAHRKEHEERHKQVAGVVELTIKALLLSLYATTGRKDFGVTLVVTEGCGCTVAITNEDHEALEDVLANVGQLHEAALADCERCKKKEEWN